MTIIYSYFHTAAVLAALMILFYLPIGYLIKSKKDIPFIRQFAWLSFIIVLAIIGYATMGTAKWNFDPSIRVLNLHLFDWIKDLYRPEVSYKIVPDLAANGLMFVPVGLLLPMVFQRLRTAARTLVVVLGFSILIEGTQYFIGRCADIDDVMMYLIGAVAGYGIFMLVNHIGTNQIWWRMVTGIYRLQYGKHSSAAHH